MKSKRLKSAVVAALATSTLIAPLAQTALAQGQQSSGPPVAPSFLKQAGQKIFEGAQKQMLHQINEKMQSQQNPAPTSTVDPLTGTMGGVPTATTTTLQAAPCRSWVRPGDRPIACLLCIHGLGLQSNSYEFFGKEQSNRGIAVYAIDVRGFGTWMNAKGKTKVNFDECLADIKQTLESIRAANPGIPVYILGESMGGAIALRAASMYPDLVDGLISSVPAGERFNQGKTSAKVFLNLLSGMNIANVGEEIVNQATKNQKLSAQWQNDPLARLNLTPQELIQFQDFMNNNHDAAKKVVDMPVLFVQGNGDQLVKPEGTWELFNSIAAKDKSFFAVPGEHLIFEEAQTQEAGPRDQNFRIINSWLTAKVGRRNRPGRFGGGMAGGFGGGMGGMNRFASLAGRMPFINTQGLEGPSQMIDAGNYANAITTLESIRAQRPNDPNVLALLGKAYFQNGEPDKGGSFFRRAMRISRSGSDQARALNAYLLGMSQSAQSLLPAGSAAPLPFAGFGLRSDLPNNATATWGTTGGGMLSPGAKPKIYAFYANWADQCKGMIDSVAKLGSLYGGNVQVNSVNVEDAGADALVEQFKVGPIPTVVFVSPSGQVSSTIIGESTYSNYERALQALTSTGGRAQ